MRMQKIEEFVFPIKDIVDEFEMCYKQVPLHQFEQYEQNKKEVHYCSITGNDMLLISSKTKAKNIMIIGGFPKGEPNPSRSVATDAQ